MDGQQERDYTPPIMEGDNSRSGSVLLGHLTITVLLIAAIWIMLRWGLYQFGPSLWPYYVTGGIALAWQLYSMGLPRWKGLFKRYDLKAKQTEDVAQHAGLMWRGIGAIGSFAFHTTAAAVCGIHLGPWLLSRWFVWVLPLIGISSITPRADYWLQHLELVSVIPALVAGFVVSRYFEELSSWAWVVPTIILAYKLLTFTDAHASVLASADPWSPFSYYFVIQQHMPTFSDFWYGVSDPARVTEQMIVTVPFYSGVAYSVGALFRENKAIDRIVSSLRREHESGPEEAGGEQIENATEDAAYEKL